MKRTPRLCTSASVTRTLIASDTDSVSSSVNAFRNSSRVICRPMFSSLQKFKKANPHFTNRKHHQNNGRAKHQKQELIEDFSGLRVSIERNGRLVQQCHNLSHLVTKCWGDPLG